MAICLCGCRTRGKPLEPAVHSVLVLCVCARAGSPLCCAGVSQPCSMYANVSGAIGCCNFQKLYPPWPPPHPPPLSPVVTSGHRWCLTSGLRVHHSPPLPHLGIKKNRGRESSSPPHLIQAPVRSSAGVEEINLGCWLAADLSAIVYFPWLWQEWWPSRWPDECHSGRNEKPFPLGILHPLRCCYPTDIFYLIFFI